MRLAAQQQDKAVAWLAQGNLALWHFNQADLPAARQAIISLLADEACRGYPLLFGLRIATLILAARGEYALARPYFEEAIRLANAEKTRTSRL